MGDATIRLGSSTVRFLRTTVLALGCLLVLTEVGRAGDRATMGVDVESMGSGRARSSDGGAAPRAPEFRALAYLAREVPRWSVANHCYSCHNNGDAARALYTAVRLGWPVPPEALSATTRWLARPEGWDHNGGEGPFSDHRLARIQFAAALAAAVAARRIEDRAPLIRAAERLAADQGADGSWPLEGVERIGAPATYGRPLATALACGVLLDADPARFRAHVAKADRWLFDLQIDAVPVAAAVLFRLEADQMPESLARRQRCLNLLRRGQSADGGWGPYANSPPEPFDTALVVLALARLGNEPDVRTLRQRGRAFLIAQQRPDGSWPETTRPPGAESYAQRLSTAGWATLALLATRGAAEAR